MRKLTALATEDPPSASAHRDDLSPELVDILERMLARNPDERFSTPAEVSRALKPLAEGADLAALVHDHELTAAQPDPSSGYGTRQELLIWRLRRWLRPAPLMISATLLLALFFFAVWAAKHFPGVQAPDVAIWPKPEVRLSERFDPNAFGLVVHEKGWTLTSIVRPTDRMRAAGFHPVSGQLYFGNQKEQERWFYRVGPDGSAQFVFKAAGAPVLPFLRMAVNCW